MNDTTVIGPVGQVDDVTAYARAVRAWLADLPTDEVEDLTAGMEADLAERAAESGGTLGSLLGEPEAYAAELRSAAGLPPRAEVAAVAAASREPWTHILVRESHELVERHPWLRELRPTWWLVRGAVAGWVVAEVLGTGRTVLLPLVGAALSLWLGLVLRRREPLSRGLRVTLAAGNVLAVLLLAPMLDAYTSGSGYAEDVAPAAYPSELVANGEPVQNLYAYDSTGHRLDGVRVYDQSGRALVVSLDPLVDGSHPEVPLRPEDGMPDVAADVFPLSWPGHDSWQDPGLGWTPPLTLPALTVPALTGASTVTPGPTPTS